MKGCLYSILLVLILLACKKEEITFTLKGKIESSINFSGKNITLTEIALNNSNYKPQTFTIPLNADGSFEFSFVRNKVTSYIFSFQEDNYFEIYEEIPFSSFSTESALEKNYTLETIATVQINITNQAPASGIDFVKITKQEGKNNCNGCCSNSTQTFTGVSPNVLYCKTNGNSIYSILVETQTAPYFEVKEVYALPFDTVVINVVY